ncbi:MAG: type II toxin-antitoxin system antitoxin SocA domain-containing protein [Rhabdochlamydiaceae bacterium]|jgi:uncharacterized phage-associated protein
MGKQIAVSDVAKYFLLRAKSEGKKISNKKLQKLVYYAQAWVLALTNKPLFSEKIEAWIHGPAIPSLYRKFKKYGSKPIHLDDLSSKGFSLPNNEVLDEVWRVYGKYDANYLETLTHQEDPWLHARDEMEFGESSNNEITRESMKNYYRMKLEEIPKNETEEINS